MLVSSCTNSNISDVDTLFDKITVIHTLSPGDKPKDNALTNFVMKVNFGHKATTER